MADCAFVPESNGTLLCHRPLKTLRRRERAFLGASSTY